MPDIYVNLDGLIPREDFEAKADQVSGANFAATQTITELETGKFFYSVLKKPDFQRETANWTPDTVAELIKSFVNDDLVPAIILWRSPSNDVFVIDGSHRLSSLIAWVQDDYGDGDISREFFAHSIPDAQAEAATKTRNIIKKEVGAYKDLKFAIANPQKALKPEHIDRAKKLGSLAINVQWVNGDATKAEHSFFKINQQGTPIDPTELSMLKARSSPNAMAARAIIRAGVGHKYWSKFPADIQAEIEKEAKNVYDNLFRPQLETPIKTTDIPIAGKAYSAGTLPLIFDLVNLSNGKVSGRVTEEDIPQDVDGKQTVEFLKKTRRLAYRISGTHPSSLGMHPVVYFYGATGRFQPTSFFGVLALIQRLESTNGFPEFTRVRRIFEDFLLDHKYLSNQITQKFGSGLKGYTKVLSLYDFLLAHMQGGITEYGDLEKALAKDSQLSFLRFEEEGDEVTRKTFSSDTKSAKFLSEARSSMIECKICTGYMHKNSITFDHVQDKKDGGSGDLSNAQIAHPYCNSTYKDLRKKTVNRSLTKAL
jgi:hypothetical protein